MKKPPEVVAVLSEHDFEAKSSACSAEGRRKLDPNVSSSFAGLGRWANKYMNTLLAGWVIGFSFVLATGCTAPPEARPTNSYTSNMAAIENWISKSATFDEFEQQVAMSQRPTYYTDIKFKRFPPAQDADLPSMRSLTRKSNHEVVIHGAARTKSGEGVEYSIVIDEAVKSK